MPSSDFFRPAARLPLERRMPFAVAILMSVVSVWSFAAPPTLEPKRGTNTANVSAAKSTDEARSRARLLHETVHGTLQIVHRDFFDDENPHAIPSASLEDLFHELSRRFDVSLSWLNVNTDVVNSDHQPSDDFEKAAAEALAAGETEYVAISDGRFRYAGPIRLASQCLKCHVKNRTSTRDRTAGLLISMPLHPMAVPDDH